MQTLTPTLSLTCLLFLAGPAVADQTATAANDSNDAGLSISAGIGVTDFNDANMRDFTSTGADWDVRLGIGTNSVLGAELAYVGSAQKADIMIEDVTLMSHGFEGLARVNFARGVVQPYAAAGLGWARYKVYVDDAAIDFGTDDDILTVPAAAGVAFRLSAVTLDLRGTYRLAFDDEMFADSADFEETSAFDRWSVAARAGVEF